MKTFRKQKYSRLITFSYSVINWVYRIYPIGHGSPKVFFPIQSKLERVLVSRGPLEAIRFSKNLRLAFIKFLAGSNERVEGVRYSSNGIPRELSPIIEKTGMKPRILAVILTVLTITRSQRTPANPDWVVISAPPKQEIGNDINTHIRDFWTSLGYSKLPSLPKSLQWNKFHYTTKNGPNGQALWTCLIDFQEIFHNRKDLQEAICSVGGKRLRGVMYSLGLISEALFQIGFPTLGDLASKDPKQRKLVAFPDKEGKTRIIAIQDYWSQTALRPLHTWIFNQVLKRIPQDCTFAQGSFLDKLKGAPVYYSIDLTAATDRFPIALIESVQRGRFPDSFVKAWSFIMVGLPFKRLGHEEDIFYGTGNPMGAYSSWATFAMAHHYVVYHCCRNVGVQWKELQYTLLGDDIVIANKCVAEEYLRVIKALGVDVSQVKTHISTDVCEFAKRWIYKDTEITPFPITAQKESQKRYYSLINLLLESEVKGWFLSCSIPKAIELFYTFVSIKPSNWRVKQREKVVISEFIMKIMRDSLPVTSINELSKLLGIHLPELTQEECQGILSNVVVELFADSNPENFTEDQKKKSKPQGLVAQLAIMRMTEPEIESQLKSLGFDQPSKPWYIPQLSAYATVEEQYLELRRKARRVDTIHAGEWPQLLKAMLLPISDEAFYARASEMMPFASSIIGVRQKERLLVLSSPMGRRQLGR